MNPGPGLLPKVAAVGIPAGTGTDEDAANGDDFRPSRTFCSSGEVQTEQDGYDTKGEMNTADRSSR